MTGGPRGLVKLCTQLGTVPVALFTNGVVAVLQKFAECDTLRDACAAAGLHAGVAIPVACGLGACGLAAGANALTSKADAEKLADEFAAHAKTAETIEQAVLNLANATQGRVKSDDRLSEPELLELAQALDRQDATLIKDGTAQKLMLVLHAAKLATKQDIEQLSSYTKETWHRALKIDEKLAIHGEWLKWLKDSDRIILAGLADLQVTTERTLAEAAAANAKADQILAALLAQNITITLEDRVPPKPIRYVERPALMTALVDALWEKGISATSTRSGRASVNGRAAAQGDGGQGKSVLALAYAHDYADKYPGGCYRVVVENQSLEAALARMIPALPALNAMPQADKARLARAILSREPRSLLIIDNVDRVSDWNDATFQSLIPAAPCHVIVTSREESLPGIDRVAVGKLEVREAIEVLASFRPSADEPAHAQAVASILRSVERLAVAVASVGALMQIADDDDWAAYAARLEAIPLDQYPEGHAGVVGHTGYTRRVYAALDDLFGKLPVPAQRAMEYAALLPEDLIPAIDRVSTNAYPPTVKPTDWLADLLTKDAAREGGDLRLVLGTRPTGRPWEGRDFVRRLQTLGLLTPASPEKTLWSLHRLHAKRCKERLNVERMTALTLALAAHAASRRAVIVGVDDKGKDRGVTNPAALTDQTLRWELAPLAALCTHLWSPPSPSPLAPCPSPAARIGVWLAPVLQQLGRYAEAAACLTPVAEHEAAVLAEIGHEDLASCTSNLAMIQQDQGDLAGARDSMERAIAIDLKHFAPDHPILATRYNNLAMVLKDIGEFAEALRYKHLSMEIERKHLGEAHPQMGASYSNLALIQKDQGDLVGARASMERAIAIAEKNLGPEHPNLATMRSNLAGVQQDQGDLVGARASMERAIAIEQKHFAPDHPTLAASYNNLATICYYEGDRAGACANFKKALDIWRNHFPDTHPNIQTVLESMKIAECV